jgi:ABC-type branched-subunit amino acid transport system substrate-binding protein
MKRFCAVLLILLLVCGGCAKTPTVKIGVIEPLTGEYAAGGQLEYQGILEAHKEKAQAAGMVVELVVADNQSTEEGARKAAKQLVDAGVSIVIGSWGSTLSAAAAPVFEKAKIPAVATTAVVYDNDSYFSLGLAEGWQGKALAAEAAERGWARVAVLYDPTSAYDIAIRNAFIEAAGKDRICAEALVEDNLADCVAAMEREQAQALLIPSLADEAQTALPVLGGDLCESESVYHVIYGGVANVGYDAYGVAVAMLEGATAYNGRTGCFAWDAALIRTEYLLQTPNGIEKRKFS